MPRLRISLRNRLALVFFAITFVAIGVLYLYVAPGLETRLISEKLQALAGAAQKTSGPIARTVGGDEAASTVSDLVRNASAQSGDRVTLLSVSTAVSPGGPQLTKQADSSPLGIATSLSFPAAYRAATTGRLSTGTESSGSGEIAEAAHPVSYDGGVARVIVYSAPVADIVRNVAIVRHEILVAGGIALLLALVGGYLQARALAQRVKRLELAAGQIAAGDFEHPIPVDSSDELGQLAVAFNEMQRQLAQLESARKKFIATASHELRTPIFSLGGFVELLEDEDLDAETRRRFLDQVARPGRAAAQAVGGPPRSLAARVGVAGAAPRGGRPRGAHPRRCRGSSSRRSRSTTRISSCGWPGGRSRSAATRSASPRSCGS